MGGPCLGAFGMIRKSLSAFEPSRVKYVKLRRYRFKMDAFAGHWLQHLCYGWLVEFTFILLEAKHLTISSKVFESDTAVSISKPETLSG